MLDTGGNPDCPQCMRSAEFVEDKQQVFTHLNQTVWFEAIERKNLELDALEEQLELEEQPMAADSGTIARPPSSTPLSLRGEK
jgi:hypothetical protein